MPKFWKSKRFCKWATVGAVVAGGGGVGAALAVPEGVEYVEGVVAVARILGAFLGAQ